MKKKSGRACRKKRQWAFDRSRERTFRSLGWSCACVVLCIALAAYLANTLSYFQSSGNQSQETSQAAAVVTPPVTFNMLLAVLDSDSNPVELMLLRLDADNSRLVVMPIPSQLKTDQDNQTLASEFSQGCADKAVASLEKSAGIKINYRCIMTTSNFSEIISLFGGFTYDVPVKISSPSIGSNRTIEVNSGSNLIDGTKALAVLNGSTSLDTSQQYAIQSGMMKAFATQKLAGYYLQDNGSFFKKIFNLISTDYSMNALLSNLPVLQKISSKSSFVTALTPSLTDSTGSSKGCRFDSKTIALLKEYFSAN